MLIDTVLGSVIPGAGTIAGGAIGGVVGWFGTDAAFVSVDEWLNRDEFEADLRDSITDQKNSIKKDLLMQFNEVKSQFGAITL